MHARQNEWLHCSVASQGQSLMHRAGGSPLLFVRLPVASSGALLIEVVVFLRWARTLGVPLPLDPTPTPYMPLLAETVGNMIGKMVGDCKEILSALVQQVGTPSA